MNNNISPHLYVLSTFSTALLSLYLFYRTGISDEYFFLPIFGLALVYALINFSRQRKGRSAFSIQRGADLRRLFKRSLARYGVWLVVLFTAAKFYEFAPYYSALDFRGNRILFAKLLDLYLALGLPYFMLTLYLKASRVEDFYDPAVRLIHIFKQTTLRTLRGDGLGSVLRVFKTRYNRKVLLNLLMRAYFVPIMVIQVYYNLFRSLQLLPGNAPGDALLAALFLISMVLWLTDTLNASLSYCLESRWLENRSRSIDLTVSGWAVCLFCYAPLNNVTGYLFPFAPVLANNNPATLVYGDMTFLYAIKLAEIAVLAVHIYSDVSLGPAVANITLKKLQTRGPYGIVRHPGTTTKLLLWTTQSFFYARFWSIRYLYGYLMWGVIYILRALTEERHLNQYEEYRAYKKKVRYRFFPWLF